MSECQAALDLIAEVRSNAPVLSLLFGIAAAVLIWDTFDTGRRERICKECGQCQTRIHGHPDMPPPKGGVRA